MTTTAPQPLLINPTGWGIRCILCDRIWPPNADTRWHPFVVSEVEPVLECSCEATGEEPTWHAFDVHNSRGYFVAAGVVCPTCVTTHGLDAAVEAATLKAMRADQGAN